MGAEKDTRGDTHQEVPKDQSLPENRRLEILKHLGLEQLNSRHNLIIASALAIQWTAIVVDLADIYINRSQLFSNLSYLRSDPFLLLAGLAISSGLTLASTYIDRTDDANKRD
jgi:hypothetical protein